MQCCVYKKYPTAKGGQSEQTIPYMCRVWTETGERCNMNGN